MFFEPFLPDSYCILSYETCLMSQILPGHVSQLQVGPGRDLLTPEIIKPASRSPV